MRTPTEYEVSTGLTLTSKVNVIYQAKDGVHASVIDYREADRSVAGKSCLTSISGDLDLLVSKLSLEEQYPGIILEHIYLCSKEDTREHPVEAFVQSHTLNSNIFALDFADYYENGIFNRDLVLEKIHVALQEKAKRNCYSCSVRSMCQSETISQALDEVKGMAGMKECSTVVKKYSLDSLTEEQKAVVLYQEGNMVVCAGPGSGKTHTLVTRTLELMKRVPYVFILCITYTTNAADEMRSRLIAAGVPEDELPRISTIHSLALDILKEVGERYLGYIPKILSDDVRKGLVAHLIASTHRFDENGAEIPLFDGISFASMGGNNGTVCTVIRLIKEYAKGEDYFYQKYPDISSNFSEFVEKYNRVLEAEHYVDFDDCIRLVNEVLERNDYLREGYSSMYQHIMVDEYQDVDAEQHKFVSLLHNNSGNLVVFGDDDQSIYGFRGGSNYFMMQLAYAENFGTMVLTKNFRSKADIVAAASGIIQGTQRIDKQIRAVRESDGRSLRLSSGTSASSLDAVIHSLVERDGYSYGDICITSSANSTLISLARSLTIPCVLQKRFLRDTALFRILYHSLRCHFMKSPADSILSLLRVLEADEVVSGIGSSSTAYNDLAFYKDNDKVIQLKQILQIVDSYCVADGDVRSIPKLIREIALNLGLRDSMEEACFNDILEKSKEIVNVYDFYNHLTTMLLYESDEKVPVLQNGRVLLVTQHESKGMEWPVVIYVSTSEKSAKADEEFRLLYVSVTRAKDVFIHCGVGNRDVLQNAGASLGFKLVDCMG